MTPRILRRPSNFSSISWVWFNFFSRASVAIHFFDRRLTALKTFGQISSNAYNTRQTSANQNTIILYNAAVAIMLISFFN